MTMRSTRTPSEPEGRGAAWTEERGRGDEGRRCLQAPRRRASEEHRVGLDRYRGPEYRRLLAAARKSLERTGGERSGRVSVAEPDDDERKAIIGITGIHQPAGTRRLTVPLAYLDTALRGATGLALEDALAALGGPVRDRRAEAASLACARTSLIAVAEASPLRESCDWYRAWLADLLRDGTLTRLAHQGDAAGLGHAIRALEHIAVQPTAAAPAALPDLPAHITGDTQPPNHGTTLAT